MIWVPLEMSEPAGSILLG